jgi:tetratricopeptide (TPR) repeat protein
MRKYTKILKILWLLLITFDCFAQSDSYFDRIAVVSDGRITRYTDMPISVYAENPDPYAINCLDALNYALKEWEEQSAGIVKFQLLKEPEGADILISWRTKLEGSYKEHPLGIAELHRTENDKYYVQLIICLRDPITAKPLSTEQFQSVLLHEIGHAIGLWGHSKDKNDIMFYATNSQKPTINDIMTLKLVYSHENGYSLHEKSIAILQEDIAEKPSEASLYYLLGTIYQDQKKYTEATESLKKCLELNPQYHKARVALASIYKSNGQEQLAVSEYMNLAKSEPSAMIHNVIGTSFYNNGNFNEAIAHYKKSLELDRTYEPAKRNLYGVYVNRSSKLIDEKKYEDTTKFLSEGIKLFPDKPELFNLLGVAYSEMGLYDKAIDQYRLALNYNPLYKEAKDNIASCYNTLGIKYAQSNQWEKAIEAYKQAMAYAPEMDEIRRNISALYWNRAVYYSSIGDTNSALNAYLDYIKLEPNNSDAYNNLGAVYSRLGRFDESIKALESALNLEPNSLDIKLNLSIAHQKYGYDFMQKQFYDKAIEEFKKALELNQQDTNLYLLLAVTHDRVGKLDEAIKYSEKALELDPDNINAKKIITNLKIHLGNKSLEAENYDQALKYYTTIPEDMKTYQVVNNIAYIYIKKGMYMQAMDQIDLVLQDDPKDKTANNNLASIEAKIKEQLAKDSNSQEAKDLIGRVKLSMVLSFIYQGEIEKAKRNLIFVVGLEPNDKSVKQMLIDCIEKLADAYEKKGFKDQAREIRDYKNELN